MKNTKVIINEQHQMLDEQKEILRDRFPEGFEILEVPASGWTTREMNEKSSQIIGSTIVFVSPIPAMIKELSFISGYAHKDNCSMANAPLVGMDTEVFVFHNDNREKKELPNGKIIQVVAKTGWLLV